MTTEKLPPTSVKHFANIGDIIAALPACKTFYEKTGRKVIFHQMVDQLAAYYAGATHPTLSDDGQMVCVNQKMFDMIKPLVESQEYIDSFVKYQGQQINIDFDRIRGEVFVNLPHGMIQSWVFYAWPDLSCDLSEPWIFLPKKSNPIQKLTKGKIIVNFTERYRNHNIDYFFLKEYEKDLVFAGTEREHGLFCGKWNLEIPRLIVNDFLEYAYALKACAYFIGNQSFGWNLSQAMHVPRILEVCNYAANCMPFIGEDSYGYFHQTSVVYFTKLLYEKKIKKAQ